MKLVQDVDRFVSGEAMSLAQALRLAARLEKTSQSATRTEAGLFELARERLLVHALRVHGDTVRVSAAPDAAHLLCVRAKKGVRAPKANIPIDRVPQDLRDQLSLEMAATENASESVPGLCVAPVDAASRLVFDGMTGGDCAQAAQEAEEAYDYDRALAGWRLSVVRSQGHLDHVRELARFLSEAYGDYAETATLLTSPRLNLSQDVALQKRLADALYRLEDPRARSHYEELLHIERTATVLLRLGTLDLRDGLLESAHKRLASAAKMDPGDLTIRRTLEKCRVSLNDIAETLMNEARVARDAGDHGKAQSICAEMKSRRITHPKLDTFAAALRADAGTAQAESLLREAETAAERGAWREAATQLRAIQDLDTTVYERAHALKERVTTELAEQNYTQHMTVGDKRYAESDWAGTLLAFNRAIETGVLPRPEHENHPLLQQLLRFRTRTKNVEQRHLDGLAAQHNAEVQLNAGRLRAAEQALREAHRHLRNDPDVMRLEQDIASRRKQGKLQEAREAMTRAATLETSEDLEGALAAVEHAIECGGETFENADQHRQRLRDALSAEEAQRNLHRQLEKLVRQERWWALLRKAETALQRGPNERVEVFRQRARTGIDQKWRIERLPLFEATSGDALQLSGHAPSDDSEAQWILSQDPEQNRLLLGTQDRLLIVHAEDVTQVIGRYRLPSSLGIDPDTTRLYADGAQILVFDARNRSITRLEPKADGTLVTRDHRLLDRSLSGEIPAKTLATETRYDAATSRLLTLLPDHSGRHPSRLLSISISDGQVHNEERFNFPAFNLRRIDGDSNGHYTVQRKLDMRHLRGHFYNFAVMDARTRIFARPFFTDFDEPMHAVRRISAFNHPKFRYICQYWFVEPLTGHVIDQSNGFALLKEDWSPYYQISQPDTWFRDSRTITQAFGLHDASASLFFPWRRYGKKTTQGLSCIPIKGLRPSWDVELPEGVEVRQLFDVRECGKVYAWLKTETGESIHSVDIEARQLCGLD